MIYKNVEFHNVAELIDNQDGSVSWKRVPSLVHGQMESKIADNVVANSTGVELRFVIKGESVTIKMSTVKNNEKSFGLFHVYRGEIQGGCKDHEAHLPVTDEVQDFVITKSANFEMLDGITEKSSYGFDSEVVRIIFDRGRYKIYDIIGEVEPPKQNQVPKKTILFYGSSITHGSFSMDMSHSWASVVGHNLNMDVRNLGMAGSCLLEPAFAEYIASQGEADKWDIATLELGINVLEWEDQKIKTRVENMIKQVAGRNKEKPVFIISPFYHSGDDFNPNDRAKVWREIIKEEIERLNYKNVTYINGFEVLDHSRYITADGVHPNIYGVSRIAEVVTDKIKNRLKAEQ